MNRWVKLFLSRFTPEEAPRIPQQLVESAAGWAGHIEKLESELHATPASHPRSWGFHDYIATLLIRDEVEKLLPSVPAFARDRVLNFIHDYDSKLTSFTDEDREELFIRFTRSGGGLAEEEFMASQWWWHRIPQSGPVTEELLDWYRRTSERNPDST